MASAALKMENGTEIPGEEAQIEAESGIRDFDAEAREHGWLPKDEFKGDESRWVDAETFMKRADDMMPLLKAQNAKLKRDLDAIKKDLRRATQHFDGAEQRAYERALKDLEAKLDHAVESGDTAAARGVMKEIGELKPEAAAVQHTKEEAQEALDAFREENPWYDRANLANASEMDINARLYFDRMIDRHIERTKTLAPAEFFGMIRDLTAEKFPLLNAKALRQKPASAVEGATAGRGGRGLARTWENLPNGAKRQYQRFIDRGIGIKSTGDRDKDLEAARKYYARSHDWEGYKE